MLVSRGTAACGRRIGQSPSNGEVRWYIDYIGEKVEKVEDKPESNLIEMDSNQTVVPHFHQVNQFQIMADGAGSLGRNSLKLIALHYVDHNTAYGPIKAGPNGLSLFTLRAQSDPSATYLHQPGYKEALKPSKRRYLLVEDISLSVESVLKSRKTVALESLFEKDVDTSDGLGAFVMRLGAGVKALGPDPGSTSGQYYLILNGGLERDGLYFPKWSMVFVNRADPPFELCAGPEGLETLVVHLPRLETASGTA